MLLLKAWVNAARLRTLPLSVSGIFVGTAMANYQGSSNTAIFILSLITTIGFQVTSNFANDYGDGVKGTDNNDRVGPARALQSGRLTKQQLKKGIGYSILLNLIFVLLLLYTAFGMEYLHYIAIFMLLGILSLWAAIRYTVGDGAYGYKGLGDLFVFLFFGLLSVLGSKFLYTRYLDFGDVLPAITIGLLSTAVLNLNNLRDFHSDRKSGKNTVIVKLGPEYGKRYHYGLIICSFLSLLAYILIDFSRWSTVLCLLAYVPIYIHLRTVYTIKEAVLFDPELKKMALSTFLLAVLFYIGYNNFL